ncbi:MAG: tRNA (adenosine(37)-N6)-dimethylallyltransferase MiaA [Actinobacteria bacterium]|nr:tRNA (adenosine(37)-N6)-dimethylallyltransferase MiaA [Actinomycetota bacterium]
MAGAGGEIRVAAILGPTAVGKSRVAVELASLCPLEIISVDSMQVYRGMDIGTAKPDESLRRRVVHHMIDVVEAQEEYSVALFQAQARDIMADTAARGRLPLLVGGTGLYFEAAVFDLRFPPGSRDDRLRRDIEDWARRDPEGLRRSLAEVDPDFACGEGMENLRRVARAMEVYRRTGRPFSSFQVKRGQQRPLYRYAGVVLTLPREELYRRIDRRVEEMFAAGLVEEVRGLLSRGGLSRTAAQALGYREVIRHLDRGIPLEETITEIKRRSRNYAKRQLTWFRRVPGLLWMEMEGEEGPGSYSAAARRIHDHVARELGLG